MNTLNILVIYIFIWLLPGGADGREIHINDNITGVLGSNNIELKCLFIKDGTDVVGSVTFLAKNSSQFEDIAIFLIIGGINAYLTPFGVYLFGNKILNNITESSTEAVIVLTNLTCKHEREYKCILYGFAGGTPFIEISNPTTLSVEVLPGKPDNITIDKKIEDHNSLALFEGENVTFTCFGDVGRPPGEYQWQKISTKGTFNYSNCITSYERLDESCSNKGTSSLTLRMEAEDNQAVIRCVEISQMANEEKYQETGPIEVYYKVRKPILLRQPSQDIYGQSTEHIVLACESNGNPKPSYAWYRNETLIALESIFVIWNVVGNNSGSYVCRVHNIVEGKEYSELESIFIAISDDRILGQNTDSTKGFIPVIIGLISSAVIFLSVASCISIIICRHSKTQRPAPEYDTVLSVSNSTSQYDDLRTVDNHYCNENIECQTMAAVNHNTIKETSINSAPVQSSQRLGDRCISAFRSDNDANVGSDL